MSINDQLDDACARLASAIAAQRAINRPAYSQAQLTKKGATLYIVHRPNEADTMRRLDNARY